jgi:methionyl-tRNA formyltransferase
MKVIFLGTPEFALSTLEMLIKEHQVVLCVTKPDAPKGRGGRMQMPPVKEMAVKYGIPVYQPERAKTDEFYETLKNAGADVMVTCAYGKILPERVLRVTPYGCVNVHASLLPNYRGSAPLWHAVIDGAEESGVTTMQTDAGMDTGDILLRDRIRIGENTTMGELHDMLAAIGPVTLMKTLAALEAGTVTPEPQDPEAATYAPPVDRDTGIIDWTKDAKAVHDLVRGTNPFPVASSILDGRRVKIWKTAIACRGDEEEAESEAEALAAPGECYLKDGRLLTKCGRGSVEILEIQGEGARRMTFSEYRNGHSAERFE